MKKPKKTQFNFDDRSWNDLNQLTQDFRAPSRAQALRQAITLALFIVKWVKKGYTLTLVKEGEPPKEILIAFIPE